MRELAVGAGGAIVRFAADFEQHCEGLDPALFGSVRYNSTVPTVAPFDGSYPVYQLTIVPGAHGVVTGNGLSCGPAQSSCVQSLPAVTSVVLTGTPDRGYALRGWSGDCTGGRTTSVRVNSLKQCTPIFVPTVVPHDLDADGLGDVAVWRPGNGTWYWGTSSSGFNDAAARSKQWGNKDLGDVPFLGRRRRGRDRGSDRLAREHRHVVLADLVGRLRLCGGRIEAVGQHGSGRRADGRRHRRRRPHRPGDLAAQQRHLLLADVDERLQLLGGARHPVGQSEPRRSAAARRLRRRRPAGSRHLAREQRHVVLADARRPATATPAARGVQWGSAVAGRHAALPATWTATGAANWSSGGRATARGSG